MFSQKTKIITVGKFWFENFSKNCIKWSPKRQSRSVNRNCWSLIRTLINFLELYRILLESDSQRSPDLMKIQYNVKISCYGNTIRYFWRCCICLFKILSGPRFMAVPCWVQDLKQILCVKDLTRSPKVEKRFV